MKNSNTNLQRRRKGIFFLLLPFLVIPILLILNWKLSPVQASGLPVEKGLNTHLPEPRIREQNSSKAEAYAYQKDLDSRKSDLKWAIPNLGFGADPAEDSLKGPEETLHYPKRFSASRVGNGNRASIEMATDTDLDNQKEEILIQERLSQIQEILNTPERKKPEVENAVSETSIPEVLHLEQLMAEMESPQRKEPDPELAQLESLMDKILQIQYPDRVQQENSIPDQTFSALPKESLNSNSELAVSVLNDVGTLDLENGFFGLEESLDLTNATKSHQKTFAAVVQRTQEILPGEALELQLQEELVLGNQLIPSGTTVYGTTSLSGNRLQINVSGILWNRDLIPVSLKGYGLDALPGLEINSVKGSAQLLEDGKSGIQNINLGSLGMDWEAQVANSGINATRKFLNSKIKAKPITIKEGHPLLLVNSNSNSNR